jgi:YHS domain-containing protein
VKDVNELVARIEGAFTKVKDRIKQEQHQELRLHQDRQELLNEYAKAQAKVVEIAKPRLEALAKRAGDRATVTPSVSETRRSVRFEFRSPKVFITLTFAVAPDKDLKNVVVDQNLQVVPVLWRFDPHSEFSTPIKAVDADGLAKWLDDRIVAFVELFVQIHESELYDKVDYVEDPIAKIKFPKFAAAATLDHDGKTHFFISEETKATFARQKGLAVA